MKDFVNYMAWKLTLGSKTLCLSPRGKKYRVRAMCLWLGWGPGYQI